VGGQSRKMAKPIFGRGLAMRCERSEHGKSQLSIKFLCVILISFSSFLSALRLKTDSFVVESNVHFPTDCHNSKIFRFRVMALNRLACQIVVRCPCITHNEPAYWRGSGFTKVRAG